MEKRDKERRIVLMTSSGILSFLTRLNRHQWPTHASLARQAACSIGLGFWLFMGFWHLC